LVARSPRLLDEPVAGIRKAEFSPNGQLLAAKEASGRVHVWNAQTGRKMVTFDDPHEGYSQLLAISPDGTMVVAKEGRSGELLRWELPSGKPLTPISDFAHSGPVAFAAGGKKLIWSVGPKLTLYDLETQERSPLTATDRPHPIHCLAVAADGK